MRDLDRKERLALCLSLTELRWAGGRAGVKDASSGVFAPQRAPRLCVRVPSHGVISCFCDGFALRWCVCA